MLCLSKMEIVPRQAIGQKHMRRKIIKYVTSVLDVIDEQQLAGRPLSASSIPASACLVSTIPFRPPWWGAQKERWLALVTACACQ